jgi:transcriptional regulator with XRE-family HTH domain
MRIVVQDIERIRLDAGLSIRAVARAANVDAGYLSLVLNGRRLPSVAVLTAIADALGADISIRVYPNTGPRIHDRFQAKITEELLRIAHRSWRRSVEVPVLRPARGVIDVVFHRSILVATEIQSRIDRLEQQIRWAREKAQSLPSSDLWRSIEAEPVISQLLVVQSTRATRELARRFEETLRVAYAALARDAYRALVEAEAQWPGAAILWADVDGEVVRIRDNPPRGILVGRG